jgi:capsid protein
MQEIRNCGLAQRTRETMKTQIYIIGFLDIIKKHISNQIGLRVETKVNKETWIFSLFGENNLTLAVKYNGKCSVYSQKPLDPENETDRKCMSIYEFLTFELINQHVKKLQLEKILFQIV